MSGHRIDRTTEDIKRELTAILRELKDPRVKNALISVVRAEVTNDLSYCKVYISAMEGQEAAKEAVWRISNLMRILSAAWILPMKAC